jgi:succinoglycan biosynthesis transport protein ExoP
MKLPDEDKARKPSGVNSLPPGGGALAETAGSSGYYSSRASEGSVNRFDPRLFIGIFLGYWWLILVILLAGAASGAAYCILGTPKYKATCMYEIIEERVLEFGSRSTEESLLRGFDRQMMMLQSEALKTHVETRLAPEWMMQIEDLEATVAVQRERRNSTILQISVTAVDEDYAVRFLEELLASYEEMRRIEQSKALDNALRGLRLEKVRIENDLEDAERQLVRFEENHNLKLMERQAQHAQEFLGELLERENRIKMERTMIGVQLNALENANVPTIQDVLALTLETGVGQRPMTTEGPVATVENEGLGSGMPEGGLSRRQASPSVLFQSAGGMQTPGGSETIKWRSLEQQLAGLKDQYTENLRKLRPSHPAMVELLHEIEKTRKDLEFEGEIARKRLQARFDALKILEDAIGSVARAWRTDMALDIPDRAEYSTLKNNVGRLRGFNDQLGERMVSISSKSNESIITRKLTDPESKGKIWPNAITVMTASLGGSVALGLALAFGLFFYDSRFMDVMAIEQKLGLEFISGIPLWERVIHHVDPDTEYIIIDKAKPNAVAEAYRSLRTNIETRIGNREGGYSLLLTSTDAAEGKSVTVCNLGIAFSWTGKRVLVVDGDLRRANIHNLFGIEDPGKGLSELLIGEVDDWHDLVLKTKHPNVDILPAGEFNRESPELCTPARMRELCDQWDKEYDIVLLDTAPVGCLIDAAMMARGVDGVLMVCFHGRTSFSSMRHALRRLDGTNVLGFVLNAIDIPRSHGRYTAAYFGYRWRYDNYAYYYYYSTSLYGYGAYKYRDAEAAKAEAEPSKRQQKKKGNKVVPELEEKA